MKRAVIKFLLILAVFTALFVVQKPIFMLVYASRIGAAWTHWLTVPFHGLSMDISMAAYLTVIPGLLIATALITPRRWPRVALEAYMWIVSALISIVFLLDIVLYGYWGFRLDMTPFFYFFSSPAVALASAEWWMIAAALLAVTVITVLVWWVIRITAGRINVTAVKSWRPVATIIALTLLLAIPIRGSVTVSTMNPSRAYFSTNRALNHAAINPAFNLLYSAAHQSDFGTRYRFFDDFKAEKLFSETIKLPADTLTAAFQAGKDASLSHNNPGATLSISNARPDVYVIVLESFSAHLLPSLGGEPVAVGIDSIARTGVLFENMYASSFRTDRSLPAIFSGLPAQPSASIVKYVDKIDHLPSFPREMKRQGGYHTTYYYGGDPNFSNKQAYLMAMDFDRVVCDRDFTLRDKASKWGAHDHLIFSRALSDIASATTDAPRLTVIQTLSSHEPFEVPYRSNRWGDIPQANAFAYTDSCVTAFVNALHNSERWDNSLILMVPDHYGAWPKELPDMPARHHVPLIITGGALVSTPSSPVPASVSAISTQVDIASTLLGLLDMDYGMFPFSRNLFATTPPPPIAIFTETNGLCAVTPDGYVELDPDADMVTAVSGLDETSANANADKARAWLQTLYEYINNL